MKLSFADETDPKMLKIWAQKWNNSHDRCGPFLLTIVRSQVDNQ